jgi:hypothetical protein
MKGLDTRLLKVFLCGLPLVALFAVFYEHIGVINGFAGLVFALWMTLSFYLSLRLIFSGTFKEQVISRITFIRERDEREAILTGKATKNAFLTSLAILILLFCLSCFQVSFYRMPPENAIDGKTGFVSLGVGFDFLERDKQLRTEDIIAKEDIFIYKGLPVSSSAVILLLIVWQIAYYNYTMRKLLK